jgi:tRNA pseudouridine38-40 synthase
MERYQIIIAYDGTAFAGSQRQANARTVQSELEAALHRLGWQGNSVLMAGRTDSGVHASGQCVAFDLDWHHPTDELLKALNANLPADMAANSIRVVKETFHPRFDATSRRYCYRLFCQPVRDPLRERYAWRVWPPVDVDSLHNAASLLLGRHDFAAYGTAPRPGGSTTRTVTKSEWRETGDEWHYEVQAEAFLYRMVRKLVHTQVLIAQGKLTAQVISDAFEGRPRVLPGGIAPAHGLTLVEVTYPDDLEKNSSS